MHAVTVCAILQSQQHAHQQGRPKTPPPPLVVYSAVHCRDCATRQLCTYLQYRNCTGYILFSSIRHHLHSLSFLSPHAPSRKGQHTAGFCCCIHAVPVASCAYVSGMQFVSLLFSGHNAMLLQAFHFKFQVESSRGIQFASLVFTHSALLLEASEVSYCDVCWLSTRSSAHV